MDSAAWGIYSAEVSKPDRQPVKSNKPEKQHSASSSAVTSKHSSATSISPSYQQIVGEEQFLLDGASPLPLLPLLHQWGHILLRLMGPGQAEWSQRQLIKSPQGPLVKATGMEKLGSISFKGSLRNHHSNSELRMISLCYPSQFFNSDLNHSTIVLDAIVRWREGHNIDTTAVMWQENCRFLFVLQTVQWATATCLCPKSCISVRKCSILYACNSLQILQYGMFCVRAKLSQKTPSCLCLCAGGWGVSNTTSSLRVLWLTSSWRAPRSSGQHPEEPGPDLLHCWNG